MTTAVAVPLRFSCFKFLGLTKIGSLSFTVSFLSGSLVLVLAILQSPKFLGFFRSVSSAFVIVILQHLPWSRFFHFFR